MGWRIEISHAESPDGTRLSLLASPEIPDDVISTLVSAYWVEEVQVFDDDWDPSDFEPGSDAPTGRLQG